MSIIMVLASVYLEWVISGSTFKYTKLPPGTRGGPKSKWHNAASLLNFKK